MLRSSAAASLPCGPEISSGTLSAGRLHGRHHRNIDIAAARSFDGRSIGALAPRRDAVHVAEQSARRDMLRGILCGRGGLIGGDEAQDDLGVCQRFARVLATDNALRRIGRAHLRRRRAAFVRLDVEHLRLRAPAAGSRKVRPASPKPISVRRGM